MRESWNNLKKVYVYDIVPANAERFIDINKQKYPNIAFINTSDIESAARESDIIDCVTLATEPFIKGAWLKKGALQPFLHRQVGMRYFF